MPEQETDLTQVHPKTALLRSHIDSIVTKRGVPPSLSRMLTEARITGIIRQTLTPEDAVRIASLVIISASLTGDNCSRYIPDEPRNDTTTDEPPQAEAQGEDHE